MALRKAIAFANHLKDVDVVGQPVEERAGQPLGIEGFCPCVEAQIAGDQRGAALVALGDHFKRQLRQPWTEARSPVRQ